MKRELWESITDLLESAVSLDPAKDQIRIKQIVMDMPLVVTLIKSGPGFVFLADAPESRMDSGFLQSPSRIQLTLREETK